MTNGTKALAQRSSLEGLFSLESLLSLQGATAATVLVTNVIVYLIGSSYLPYQKWTALAISLAISLYTASLAPKKGSAKWVIAVLNGLLIFASSAGINQIGAAVSGGTQYLASGAEKITFFHGWF